MSSSPIPFLAPDLSLFNRPEAEDQSTQKSLSAAQARAEILAMLQRSDDDASRFRREFTAIHQRLENVTAVDEVNTIVSMGILDIVDRLGATSQVDYLVQLMHKLSQPAPQKHAFTLDQPSWGWLS